MIMTRFLKNTFFLFLLLTPVLGFAQQPKMHLRFFTGANTHRFIYRADTISTEFLFGYQFGFGFRVTRRRLFGEVDFSFTRFGATLSLTDDPEIGIDDDFNVRINSFELPINVGYIPVKTPLVKWYLYGGLVNRFSVRGIVNFQGDKAKFSPRDINLPIYNLDMQVGTQLDVAMLNFDFHYKINLTNALREAIRTNLHALFLSVGFAF